MPPLRIGFGRVPSKPDLRDRAFTLRAVTDEFIDQFFPRGLPPGAKHFWSEIVLNQGNTGTCTAHAAAAKIYAAPIMQALPKNMSVFDLYRIIVGLDEYSDNDHEARLGNTQLQFGSSIRGTAKALQALGLCEEYRWAKSADDVRAVILSGISGVIVGSDWLTGMMDTDSAEFVSASGNVEGGHAYYVNGWSDKVRRNGRYVRAARAQNSWGTNWGKKGRFWIAEDDLDRLIQTNDGEACAMLEIKLSPRLKADSHGGDPAKR